jgi:hypothetical protein
MSDLDTTQTVRAVTTDELYDSHRPKWYAIQLVVSEKPVNLDTMPRLDVFTAHRLYAVIGKQNDVNQFALRLGFFSDPDAARAVCAGLANYFSSPLVVRVSDAERSRFVQSPAPRAPAQRSAAPVAPVVRPSVAPVMPSMRAAAPPAPRQTLAQKPAAAKNATVKGSRPKTLAEQLMDEAREVQLSRSGRHRIPPPKKSWIERLFGAPKR